MAQISLSSAEPPKLIKLIEQMFPGVKLDPISAALTGLELDGTLNITKTLEATATAPADSVTVALTFTKD